MIDTADKVAFQLGANKGNEIVFTLGKDAFTLSGLAKMATLAADKGAAGTLNGFVNGGNNNKARWDISSAKHNKLTTAIIESMIAKVDSKRSDLGALKSALSPQSSTNLTLRLTRLMHVHVFVMPISL